MSRANRKNTLKGLKKASQNVSSELKNRREKTSLDFAKISFDGVHFYIEPHLFPNSESEVRALETQCNYFVSIGKMFEDDGCWDSLKIRRQGKNYYVTNTTDMMYLQNADKLSDEFNALAGFASYVAELSEHANNKSPRDFLFESNIGDATPRGRELVSKIESAFNSPTVTGVVDRLRAIIRDMETKMGSHIKDLLNNASGRAETKVIKYSLGYG